jgi:hypothetical protein
MVGVVLIQWTLTQDELNVPFMAAKNTIDITFKRQIEQIVFPGGESSEELNGMTLHSWPDNRFLCRPDNE